MHIRRKSLFLTAITAVIILTRCNDSPSREISYNQDIRPIFNAKCISCHGGVKQSGGFSVLFEEEAKANTESGKPAIIPGDSKHSDLINRLTHSDTRMRMPQEDLPLRKKERELMR